MPTLSNLIIAEGLFYYEFSFKIDDWINHKGGSYRALLWKIYVDASEKGGKDNITAKLIKCK